MDIFYRSIAGRRGPRRVRSLLVMAAIVAMPMLASTFGHAAGSNEPVTITTVDDGDGYLDAIRLTFASGLDQSQAPKVSSGPGDPGFRVSGYTITGFAYSGSQALDIRVAKNPTPDTGVTPALWYVPGDGGAHLGAPVGQEVGAINGATPTDGAGPVLLSVTANDLPSGGPGLFGFKGEEMFFVFSENVSLAGQTRSDRWYHFERVIRFENIASEGGTCPVDGPVVNAQGQVDFNFPQPQATNANAPSIFETSAANVFHVKMKDGHIASNRRVPGIPLGCAVGVHPDLSNRSFVTDAAGNPARGMDLQPQKLRIQPADARLVVAKTVDGAGTAPDGVLDAIELTFDQNLDGETIQQAYQVTLGGTDATISSIEPGANANQILLRLGGVGWHTGIKPRVAYAKPSTCTASGGEGLKAIVPSGGTWRTCAQTFDVLTSDGAGPVMLLATTQDADQNGRVERARVTFSEPIAGSLTNAAWTVRGAAITGVTIEPDPNTNVVTLRFAEASTPDTGSLPSVTYTRQAQADTLNPAGTHDGGNNQVIAGTLQATDGAAPVITAIRQLDPAGSGGITRAEVTFSEPIVDPASAAAFTIGGAPAAIATAPGDVAGDEVLALSVNGLTGTAPEALAYAAGSAAVRDTAGNTSAARSIAADDALVIDVAAPVATLTVLPNAPIPAGETTIRLSYSEVMDVATEPVITFTTEQGDTPITATGWGEDGLTWEGTLTVAEADCSVSTGCPVTVGADGAADPAANAQRPVTLVTKIDTVAPAAPAGETLTRSFVTGETAPDGVLNMFVRNLSVGGTIAAGEATGGWATLLLDGEPVDGATDETIGGSDTSVLVTTTFPSRTALQAAIAEGPHTLGIELCDEAGNCSISVQGLDVTADYTPDVDIALTEPAGGGVVPGGSTVTIAWDGADTGELDTITLAYSTDGGQTYPNVIETGITARDGSREWTVPAVDVRSAVVRATARDSIGNKASGASDPFVIRTNSVFSDVEDGHWARREIEAIYDAGITTGCSGTRFCPGRDVNRAQMAVFLIRALGEEGNLGAYQGKFSDVPSSHWAALHIERLADLGVTTGCGAGRFCPGKEVGRAQMAVFLIRALGEEGNLGAYQGTFSDVPSSHWAALHVERLADLEITGGCAAGRFCPGKIVNRAQMAAFLQRAFDLPMLGG